MAYYVRELQAGHHKGYQVWKITDNEAIRLSANIGGPSRYSSDSGESIWDAIRRQGAWGQPDVHELKLPPQHYFPRIARPTIPGPETFSKPRLQPRGKTEEKAIASARVQLSTLVRQLERICETVYPLERNLDAYGYDIRNLLILACTEVETHWRAVLRANGITKSRCTTRDYFALAAAMKLNEFSISFPDYPWIEPTAPFKHWDSKNPTETLKWYAAYNATKHDREVNLEEATLRFAFDAVAACFVMIVGQFGEVFGFDLRTSGRPRTFFWIRTGPEWGLADCYTDLVEIGNDDWTAVKYSF